VTTEALERRAMLSGEPMGGEFLVNTFTTSRQFAPALAIDARGDFVAVWSSIDQDGSAAGVFARRFSAAGAPLGAEFRVNQFTQNDQTMPDVAAVPDGGFVVAWMSQFQNTFGSDVYARRYDADGAPLGGEFRVNVATPGNQIDPAIATDDDGGFVVTWSGEGAGDDSGVFARRFDASGAALGGELRVNTHTPTRQFQPSIAMAPDGNFAVAWTSQVENDGDGAGVYAQRFSAAGAPQGGEFRVHDYATSDQVSPAVAMAADGSFAVTWASLGQDGHLWGVFARRFDAAGAAVGGDVLVNTDTTSFQQAPAIATDAGGDFVVSWEGAGTVAAGWDVYARPFGAGGAPLGEQFRVNSTTPNQQQTAAVAMRANGDFVIAWHDNMQDDGIDGGVYAQRYGAEAPPAVVASAFRFATAPHELRFTFDRDVSAELGADDLVLQNLTTGQTIPEADLALTYDPSANVATFTYAGGANAGVLPDGRYRATLLAAGIAMSADHVFAFHFVQGDADNDGIVNLSDFNTLAANFGQRPRTFSQGDFNYDGTVNLSDFNLLAARFGTLLAGDGRERGGAAMGNAGAGDGNDERLALLA
jgi:phosphoheptose isomerase